MSETLEQVDEIAKTIPEVAPPGWGHTVAKKEKTKPNKPKSKIGGTAHEFQKDLDSGKFKGLPGDKTYKDKKASMFKLMWSMKNKGDKPHYKPGVKDKKKAQYKEEVQNEWGDTSILSKQTARIAGRPDIGSMDNKPHRKLKITQQGLDALRKDRDRPKEKTVLKLTKKGRDALKKEAKSHSEFPADSWKTHRPDDKAVPGRTKTVVKARRKDKNYIDRPLKKEGRFASPASDPRIGGSSSVDTVPDFALKAKKGATSAPGSGSIAKAKKAKASDVNKSIEQQMADAMKETSDKWRENFRKQSAKRRGEANRRREAERDSPGQRIPSAKDDVKDLLDPHRKYKAMKKSLRGEDTNRYWHSIKEAQWKVKLKGLPSFYVPGKSAGAVRQMLRKQLKRPMDDIEDVTRATPAAKKKDFRDRAQGQAVSSGKG